jgi:Na+-translocating ferredoxin:NAD+ oxidoreductase subunit G
MAKFFKMIVVLTGISLVAGLALGALNSATKEQINENVLRFKKLPAVLQACSNYVAELDAAGKKTLEDQILKDRKELELPAKGDNAGGTALVFMAKRDGKPYAYVVESSAKGYGGPVTVLVGFDVEGTGLAGIGIATHSETPGLGSRITKPAFLGQFPRTPLETDFRLAKDGGTVDGVSGATYSSRAVSDSVISARAFFNTYREEILAAFAE